MSAEAAAAIRSISIVIVNWNSDALLDRCLASLTAAGAEAAEVIVVDNGSVDRSLDACQHRPGVRVIRNGENLGFGRACNIGARAARGAVLLFLNPDCEVRDGSLERCLASLADPTIGVCGIALVDEHGSIARSCHRFPTFGSFAGRILGLHVLSRRFSDGAMTAWAHDSDDDVDHVIGAFYMIRRALFDALGGFDERFFVYLEDLDLSLRVHRSGHRIRFLAHPASFHLGGGVSRQAKARRLFYATRSRIVFAYKHFPSWQAHLHLAMTLLLEPLTRSCLALARGSGDGMRETLRAFGWVWHDLRPTLRLARRP